MSRFVRWTVRWGRWLWLLAVVITVPALLHLSRLYLHLRSDIEELLPSDAPSVLALHELRSRMHGLQHLGVIIEAREPTDLPAAERLLDDLAARVRAYPPELVRSVRTGDGDERSFAARHAPLYLSLEDLRTIRDRIEARRDWEVSQSTGASLDDEPPPALDFSDIRQRYESRLPSSGNRPGARYSSAEMRLSMLLIEVGGFSYNADQGGLLDRVKTDIRELDPERYAPGLRVGYAGDVAISVEELSALVNDVSLSSVLVLLAVAGCLVAYYRWWPSILALGLPLVVSTAATFAVAALPPFGIRELNSNTAFLGSIIIGNGINFGIVLLARFIEERRKGVSVDAAMRIAAGSARSGTMSAALAAGVSYGSLALTRSRGFQQFGVIGGIGMLLSWLAAFVLMPPLVAWLENRWPSARSLPRRPSASWLGPIARLVGRWPLPIAIAAALLTAGSSWTMPGFGMEQVEHDFSKLRRADTWEKGEGFWGKRMAELLGEYLSPVVILADTPEQAERIHKRLDLESREGGPLFEWVSTVRGIDDVLPSDQVAKIAELRQIDADLTPRIRAALDRGSRDAIDRFAGAKDLSPVGIRDLPGGLTSALVERDGSYGKTVLVYPRPSGTLWEGPQLTDFVARLRAVAMSETHPFANEKPARVAGSVPVSADILGSIARDGPVASAAAFLGVLMSTLMLFGLSRAALQVIGALIVGLVWFAAATMILGIKINFANFIAFPITFGIGIDYAVNIVSRHEQEGRRAILGAVRSTGSAVMLCSITTIIGYSSLLVAENRALFLFGLVAVLGELACLATATVFLPSVLLVLERRAHRRSSPSSSRHLHGARQAQPQRASTQELARKPGA